MVQRYWLAMYRDQGLDALLVVKSSLCLSSMSLYCLPAGRSSDACIYFVIDSAARLLLYVAETCRSNKRWKGTHDCKRYIEKY